MFYPNYSLHCVQSDGAFVIIGVAQS